MANSMKLVDVVIIGAGPVGLLLAVCLSRWGYKVKHIDNRDGPTTTGRADGIQPRSLHLLRNMGLKRQIMSFEPARFYQVAFWDPTPDQKGIRRTGTHSACPEFIDARYPYTTLLHQGLIERVFIHDLEKNGTIVQRPWTITDFRTVDPNSTHPLEVQLKHMHNNEEETVRTKYLFSGEGAKSFVRGRLGIQILRKDPTSYVWGVMDGIVRTDFPDVKMKCTIHSDHGSIMIIPRESNMVRLYVQIASSTDKDFISSRKVSIEEIQTLAKRILQPYHIEWDHVEWFSSYPIGQGIAESYTLDQRVFMGGDCCHTHSPKAGQGMNTAFHDALNLAWKIHHVEGGFAKRSILSTYESERRVIAESLLDFDAKYATLFSQKTPSVSKLSAASKDNQDDKINEFVEVFKASQEFTSGYGTVYPENDFNWSPSHPAKSELFMWNNAKLRIGHVMPSADVTRVVDAQGVQLEQEVGLAVSATSIVDPHIYPAARRCVADFAVNIGKRNSFYSQYERNDIGTLSYHERHNPHSHFFTICTTFAAPRESIEIEDVVPDPLVRYRDHIYADDIFDGTPAHAKMGFKAEEGGVVVVRPDGHVGCVVRLAEGEGTVDALNEYFAAFVSKPVGQKGMLASL
ncbi:MAG: hypothetical protein Q9214_003246 [Letrouitia sp. 1 TL-2023]